MHSIARDVPLEMTRAIPFISVVAGLLILMILAADAGTATSTEMLGWITRIVKRTRTPVIVYSDTSYGGLLNVPYTVRRYKDTAVSAMQIKYQVYQTLWSHVEFAFLCDSLRRIAVRNVMTLSSISAL